MNMFMRIQDDSWLQASMVKGKLQKWLALFAACAVGGMGVLAAC